MYVDRYYVRKLIYFVMEEHNCKDLFFPPFVKVVKVLITVVILFTLAWFPITAYTILSQHIPAINRFKYINILWFCAHWLAMSNSCYNPFIYVICHVSFKGTPAN